jgi:hypothetical protein
MVVDQLGEPLHATHATKKTAAGKRRYRYYVSKLLLQGTGPGVRIPALELEHAFKRILDFLDYPVGELERHATLDAAAAHLAITRGPRIAAELKGKRVENQRHLVRQLLQRVVVETNKLLVSLSWPALSEMLGTQPQPTDEDTVVLEVDGRLTRSGRAIRLVEKDGRVARPIVDLKLVKLILKARTWWHRMQQGRGLTVTRLAQDEGVTQSYVTRVLRLAFLSPELIHAIMAGKQPAWLDSGALCRSGSIKLDWELQRQTLLLGRPT